MFAIEDGEVQGAQQRNNGVGAAFRSMSGGQQRVKFIRGAVIDAEKSAEGGVWEFGHARQGDYKAPVYRDAVMVCIIDPDPPHDETVREATPEDFARFPKAWDHAQKTMDLTPIQYLPGLTPAKREMCTARGLHWVEQIAQKESVCPELDGLIMIAKQYLMIAQGQKPRVKLAAA